MVNIDDLKSQLISGKINDVESFNTILIENKIKGGLALHPEIERLAYLDEDGDLVPIKHFTEDNLNEHWGTFVSAMEEAANQNSRVAQYWIGLTKESGPSNDFKEALEWIEKAANQDLPEALYWAANILLFQEDAFYQRQNITHDGKRAMQYLRRAAEQGHVRAMARLSEAYDKGAWIGTGESRNKYLKNAWGNLAQSIVKGVMDPPSKWFAYPEESSSRIKARLEAAENGDVDAQTQQGVIYANGTLGFNKDINAAVKLWKEAAEKGHIIAQRNLGAAYLMGDVTGTRDFEKARFWLKKAAEKDNDEETTKALFAMIDEAENQPMKEKKGCMLSLLPLIAITLTALLLVLS